MNRKYELTDETITVSGIELYRIRALRDFGAVKKGDLGGFVESEENLSPYGNAWITDNVLVTGNARVAGNSLVTGDMWLTGDALVTGNPRL